MTSGRRPGQDWEADVRERSIHVVGVGVAAGGFEPLAVIFGRLPSDSGMAYVVSPGADWSEARGLAAALRHQTVIPVRHVSDLTPLEPDRIHVIPPGRKASISGRVIRLGGQMPEAGGPFDAFLHSLARDKGRNAVALVLSGMGTDGARGVRAIKGAGGLTIAQDPHTAVYREMPTAAIDTGMVDLVLPAEAIVARIAPPGRHSRAPSDPTRSNAMDDETVDVLARIITEVRRRGGHDFSVYAPQAILQYVEQRMRATARGSLTDYLGTIREDPAEVAALSHELGSGTSWSHQGGRAKGRRLSRLERELEELQQRLPPSAAPARPARTASDTWTAWPREEVEGALLAAAESATLLLDAELRVVAFAAGVGAFLGLDDAGVPPDIQAVAKRLSCDGLEDDARRVLSSGGDVEREGRTAHGRDYLLRLRPRRAGGIGAAALTVVDVTSVREEANERLEAAVHSLSEQLEERVEESTGQIHALRSALTHAEQNERQRISKLLHDDLQQMLYSLELTCQQLLRRRASGENDEDLIGRMTDVIDRAIDVTRALSVELSPPVLSRRGLGEGLRWLGHHLESTFGLPVQVRGDPDLVIHNMDLRVLLFHVVRELLFNTVKHADATRAEVRTSVERGRVVVRVTDDGLGFDPAVVDLAGTSPGLGIVGVHDRLRLFGGRMDVDSSPGRGTRFTLSVPNLPEAPSEGGDAPE